MCCSMCPNWRNTLLTEPKSGRYIAFCTKPNLLEGTLPPNGKIIHSKFVCLFCQSFHFDYEPKMNFFHFRYTSNRTYPYSLWPPYCQGAFYLFDTHVNAKLFDLFQAEYPHNFVWIEDVYLTGKYFKV